VEIGGGGAGTTGLADAAAVEVGGGDAGTTGLADAAAVEVGGGGAGTTGLADAAVVEVGGGGAGTTGLVEIGGGGTKTDTVLAGAAGARTRALRESLRDKSRLRPSPRATENRIVRTVTNGVSIASVKFFARPVFWFAALVAGGSRVPRYFFCALIIAAKALFIAAPALLLAMTAPMTATMALMAAMIVASMVAVSCEAF
jgi:hypothetical protein